MVGTASVFMGEMFDLLHLAGPPDVLRNHIIARVFDACGTNAIFLGSPRDARSEHLILIPTFRHHRLSPRLISTW
jgi:hypothetical protein